MDNIEMNQMAVKMLEDWDPLNYGPEAYDTETADIVAAMQGITDATELAQVMQEVYEFSYAQHVPIESCIEMSEKLLALKLAVQCNL